MRRRHVVAVLAAAAVGAAAGAALAATAPDPADAGEKLDLKSVGGSVGGGLVKVSVGTYGPVKPADLAGTLSNLVVLLDSNGDGKADYRAQIVSKSGKPLVAMLSGHGNRYEPVPVKRSGKTLTATFPADVVTVAGKTLRVAATSTYQACACQSKHKDRAPDTGWVAVG